MAKSRRDDWFVGVQVNAISLLDEGIEPVLDLFQQEAAANAVIVTAHGFNPEVIDRPLEFPGHGERGSHHGAGGFFATPHPEFYRDVPLGDFRAREHVFSGFERVLAGYRALASAVERWRADRPGSQTPLIELLRIVMQWPEVVRWESLWTERYLALHRELYGVAKWIAPERPFGLGLWHYYFIN